MNNTEWANAIHVRLKDIANVELQRQCWSGGRSDVLLSIPEMYNQLYDDLMLDDFIDWQSECENYELLPIPIRLDKAMEDYSIPTDYSKALDDPMWIKIVKATQEVLNSWNISAGTGLRVS